MNHLLEKSVQCPYCAEIIQVLIDLQDQGQRYIEDCQVCCKPIVFMVSENMAGELSVLVYSEDDTF